MKKRTSFCLRAAVWVLGSLVLFELALIVAMAAWVPRIYTDGDGTFDGTLFYGPGWYGDSGGSRSADVTPYMVSIDSNSGPARLFIRSGSGNGRIYHVIGCIRLISAKGTHLWSSSFEGFTQDLGPALFALAFVDFNNDGYAEVVYRRRESEYRLDEEGMAHVSSEMSPVRVKRLDNNAGSQLSGLTAPLKIRLTGLRLGFSLLSPVKQLGIIVVMLLLPIGWVCLLRAGHRMRR